MTRHSRQSQADQRPPCISFLKKQHELTRISKFLSLVLRHRPEQIGLSLDQHGWAEVDELIRCANRHGLPLSRAQLEQVVAENDKQRFAFSADGRRIRANQGHSLPVDLQLTPAQPLPVLYHGTAERFVESIKRDGLLPGKRQYVHLSQDEATALTVGQRHGRPVVLTVHAAAMTAAGYVFYVSANGV
ncbi:RNA 2'-phosphotransferase [Chloroflexus sp.]|uniref:RNA 2'-phosphotransferase n=1 Tax=Chloroflexus sp. TaxID=1904827 RepID=UPI00404A8E25